MAFSNFGNLVQQGFNFTSSIISVDVLTKLPSSDQLTGQAMLMAERIKHPAVIKYIVSPGVIFSTVTLGMAKLGFGFAGIKAGGTAAAAIQASFYGGAVPAGGFFAVMQSMGALGTLNPVGMAVGAGLAGSAAFLGWAYGGSS